MFRLISKVRTCFQSSILRNRKEFLSFYKNPVSSESDSDEKIQPLGWFLLLVPITTFGLGTWQVQRKKWKEELIANLEKRVHSVPVELPEDLDELKSLEYCKVKVRGTFDHSKEFHMGPRSLLKHGDAASEGGIISKGGSRSTNGYLVITPFKLADRDISILVNRGWVPVNYKRPETRQEGQITEEISLVGIVRCHEDRPPFLPKNKPESDMWFFRDLNAMSKLTGAEPIFLDATVESTVNGGPIGGQTRVTLRNEHLSYIITWYSLSTLTGIMWYRQFVKKLPLI